jgi:hypothetical protein
MPFSFFLEHDVTSKFTKKDIDACDVSPAWAATCDAIRAVFFLSRSIRKERDAWLCFPGLDMVIVFTGSSLRYLGPDERSTLMLVDKAMTALQHQSQAGRTTPAEPRWIETTPGVRCRAIAGLDDALQEYATVHAGCTLFVPDFTPFDDSNRVGIAFPEEISGIAATGRVCVILLVTEEILGNSVLSGWTDASSRESAIKLIKAPVNTKTKLDTLASKIMVFNLIEDNYRADGT